MATDSPSRTLDRIIVRLPDGMRERLHARASAAGMSLTAYVVEVLARTLSASESDWRHVASKEISRLNDQIETHEDEIAALRRRKNEIHRQWAEIVGDMAAIDLLDDYEKPRD